MTAVTEKMVEAAMAVNVVGNRETYVRRVISAALSAEQAQPVAIKPLEWGCSPEWKAGEFVNEWFTYSLCGRYSVWCDPTIDLNLWHVSYPLPSDQPYEGTEHDTIEYAKAAAQSDYEARIRSALSAPLPEIEGGDKGDGAETITESAGRRRTELAIAEYLKVRDESMGTPDADNAERLQSAKDIHSLVIRQQGTRTRLSERNAAALAAPSAAIEGGDKRDARINWDNPEDTVVKMFVKYDVEGYVEEYEFCGEGGDYSPNERERTLLVDAIYGVVANLHEELRKIIPSSPNQGETE